MFSLIPLTYPEKWMRQNIYHKCLISTLHTILKHPTIIALVSDGRWHKIPSTCLRRRPESCGAGESCELQCDIPKIAEILEPGGGYSKRGVVAQCFLIFLGVPRCFFVVFPEMGQTSSPRNGCCRKGLGPIYFTIRST